MNIMTSLQGFPYFAAYLGAALVYMWVFSKAYTLITPYNEWKLIKDEQNTSAAIAFSGAMIGFCLALASAANNSLAFVDFTLWGVVALVAQLLAFAIIRFVYMPKIIERIHNNEISAGIVSGAISLGVGLLNAACMSY